MDMNIKYYVKICLTLICLAFVAGCNESEKEKKSRPLVTKAQYNEYKERKEKEEKERIALLEKDAVKAMDTNTIVPADLNNRTICELKDCIYRINESGSNFTFDWHEYQFNDYSVTYELIHNTENTWIQLYHKGDDVFKIKMIFNAELENRPERPDTVMAHSLVVFSFAYDLIFPYVSDPKVQDGLYQFLIEWLKEDNRIIPKVNQYGNIQITISNTQKNPKLNNKNSVEIEMEALAPSVLPERSAFRIMDGRIRDRKHYILFSDRAIRPIYGMYQSTVEGVLTKQLPEFKQMLERYRLGVEKTDELVKELTPYQEIGRVGLADEIRKFETISKRYKYEICVGEKEASDIEMYPEKYIDSSYHPKFSCN